MLLEVLTAKAAQSNKKNAKRLFEILFSTSLLELASGYILVIVQIVRPRWKTAHLQIKLAYKSFVALWKMVQLYSVMMPR